VVGYWYFIEKEVGLGFDMHQTSAFRAIAQKGHLARQRRGARQASCYREGRSRIQTRGMAPTCDRAAMTPRKGEITHDGDRHKRVAVAKTVKVSHMIAADLPRSAAILSESRS
jgi:hypothetical protein